MQQYRCRSLQKAVESRTKVLCTCCSQPSALLSLVAPLVARDGRTGRITRKLQDKGACIFSPSSDWLLGGRGIRERCIFARGKSDPKTALIPVPLCCNFAVSAAPPKSGVNSIGNGSIRQLEPPAWARSGGGVRVSWGPLHALVAVSTAGWAQGSRKLQSASAAPNNPHHRHHR